MQNASHDDLRHLQWINDAARAALATNDAKAIEIALAQILGYTDGSLAWGKQEQQSWEGPTLNTETCDWCQSTRYSSEHGCADCANLNESEVETESPDLTDELPISEDEIEHIVANRFSRSSGHHSALCTCDMCSY